MKLILLLLQFLSLACIAQTKSSLDPKFEFWVSSIDKSMFFDEINYHVTTNYLIITHKEVYGKKHQKGKVIFTAKLDSTEREILYKMAFLIRNDSLKSQYSNLCIMDGMFLVFDFRWGEQKKGTTLLNYYLDKMQPFVDFVNQRTPLKYKIWYDKTKLEKEMKKCPQNRILN